MLHVHVLYYHIIGRLHYFVIIKRIRSGRAHGDKITRGSGRETKGNVKRITSNWELLFYVHNKRECIYILQ